MPHSHSEAAKVVVRTVDITKVINSEAKMYLPLEAGEKVMGDESRWVVCQFHCAFVNKGILQHGTYSLLLGTAFFILLSRIQSTN